MFSTFLSTVLCCCVSSENIRVLAFPLVEKKSHFIHNDKPTSFLQRAERCIFLDYFFYRRKREKRLNSTFPRKIYLHSLATDSCLRQNGVIAAEQSTQSPTKSRAANQITPCNASLLSTANHKISFIQGTNQMLSSKLPIFSKGPSQVSSSVRKEKELKKVVIITHTIFSYLFSVSVAVQK